MIAVAAVGIVIGAMNMTGLGLRFASLILTFAGDSLPIALVLMMLGCIVLGMGMPTVPAYLIIVLVMGPAIEELGVPTLIVHLFVLYYGVLSSITPPVALAAYAAAPISGSAPMPTAVEAVRVALVGFLIPFVLVYNPALSLVEAFDVVDFIWAAARLSLAIWLITTALSGFERTALLPATRLIRMAAAAAALLPFIELQIAGAVVGVAALAWARRTAPQPA
jgi:TRAP-type uncharacterized transport system fused permease subunit